MYVETAQQAHTHNVCKGLINTPQGKETDDGNRNMTTNVEANTSRLGLHWQVEQHETSMKTAAKEERAGEKKEKRPPRPEIPEPNI